jgi:Flp pilus assembly protein TadG
MSMIFSLSAVVRPSRPRRVRVVLSALARDVAGVAALELALVLPFMVFTLMGIFDLGNLAYTVTQVNAAAFAGAQAAVAAAVQNSGSCSPALIKSAELSATSLGAKISTSGTTWAGTAPVCSPGYVNTTKVKGVTTNTLVSSTANCTGTCSTTPGNYAVAYAQASFSPLLPWTAFGLPKTISATAAVRYQ